MKRTTTHKISYRGSRKNGWWWKCSCGESWGQYPEEKRFKEAIDRYWNAQEHLEDMERSTPLLRQPRRSSDYLTEDWPLGPTSTVYMDGTSLYAVRRYGKPGMTNVRLSQGHADLIREVVAERVDQLQAAVDAVLELHKISCEGCDDGPECFTCWESWPCETFTAITTALGIEGPA